MVKDAIMGMEIIENTNKQKLYSNFMKCVNVMQDKGWSVDEPIIIIRGNIIYVVIIGRDKSIL
jgi:hypothetical protein